MHSIIDMATWLESTPLALWVGEGEVAYPLLLSLHVIGLAAFGGLLVVIDLYLLGGLRGLPFAGLRGPLRFAWAGLAINATSGVALFASQATVFVHNTPFLVKLAMIALAASTAGMLQTMMRRHATEWDLVGQTSGAARATAVVSLTAIAAAISAGRLIAYF